MFFRGWLLNEVKTIIMVTHDMGLKSRFTRCLTFVDGELQPETQADAKPKRSRKK